MKVIKKNILRFTVLILLVSIGGCSSHHSTNKKNKVIENKVKKVTPILDLDYSFNGVVEWGYDVIEHKDLYWQNQKINETKKFTWDNANKYCKNLSINGLGNFRLPTKDELYSLKKALDSKKIALTRIKGKFKRSSNLATHGYRYFSWENTYWTSTNKSSDKKDINTFKTLNSYDYSWNYFGNKNKNKLFNVRCVTEVVSKKLKKIMEKNKKKYGNSFRDSVIEKSIDIHSVDKMLIKKYGYPIIKSYSIVNDGFNIVISSTKGNYKKSEKVFVSKKNILKIKLMLDDKKLSKTIKFNVIDGKLNFLGIKEFENNFHYEESRESKHRRMMKDIEKETLKGHWSPIGYNDFFKKITGNTLIAKSDRYCSKNSKKTSCLKIVILGMAKNTKLKVLKRYPATIIYPDKKIIEKSDYGIWSSGIYLDFHFGIESAPINNDYHPFKSLVFLDEEKNKFLLSNPVTKEKVIVNLVKGDNTKFLKLSKEKKYKKIDTAGRSSIGAILLSKVGASVGKFVKEMSTSNITGWCYSIKNEDMKNSCLANTENKESWCYSIKNEDMKNDCLANAKNKESWCYSIKNEDMKNSCLANVKNKESWCYSIKNEDMKNSCLANTKNKESWCYSIKNEDMKNSCLANAKK